MPNTLPPAYRADSSKGAKPGAMETLPIKQDANWDPGTAYDISTAIQAALTAGMPQVGATQLVNKMLNEGRTSAGTNEYNTANKDAAKLYGTLRNQGYSKMAATYAAAVLDKSQVAERLGIPFERAWNGTGRSKDTGRTGQQHAVRAATTEYAASNPKNAAFTDYINRAISGKLTPAEHLTQLLPSAEMERLYGGDLTGNSFKRIVNRFNPNDSQQLAIVNALKDLPNASSVVQQAALNSYRNAVGVDPRAHPKQMTATEKSMADILATNPVFNKLVSTLGTD